MTPRHISQQAFENMLATVQSNGGRRPEPTTAATFAAHNEAAPPPDALAGDVQAWRSSVSNAKAQVCHQHNRLLNLAAAESGVAGVLLQYNSATTNLTEQYNKQLIDLQRRSREINKLRYDSQSSVGSELAKLTKQRDQAIWNKLQCQQAFAQIDQQLMTSSGGAHDVRKYVQKLKEEAEKEVDWNDAEHNPTTVAYNTVNVTYHQQQQQDGGGDLEVNSFQSSSNNNNNNAVKRAASQNDDESTAGAAGADTKRIRKK